MKLLTYQYQNSVPRAGVKADEFVVDLTKLLKSEKEIEKILKC